MKSLYFHLTIFTIICVNFTRSQECHFIDDVPEDNHQTLDEKISVNCSGTDLLIVGNFISLRRAIELSDTHCYVTAREKIDTLKIFSFNTLIVDADLYMTEQLLYRVNKIILISPKWEIIGTKNFDLNGIHESRNGAKFNTEAGIFFGIGIGYNFINGKNFGITARGATGQPENITLIELGEASGIARDAGSEGSLSKANITREYQHYFRKNYDLTNGRLNRLDFLEKLNNDVRVRDFSDVYDLVEELHELDNDSTLMNKDPSPFYQNLLDRIIVYAEKCVNETSKFNLLKYLYATTLSRKKSIYQLQDEIFIADAQYDLERVKNEFERDIRGDIDIKSQIVYHAYVFATDLKEYKIQLNDTVQIMIKVGLRDAMSSLKISVAKLIGDLKDNQKVVEASNEFDQQKSNLPKGNLIENLLGIANITCLAMSVVGPLSIFNGGSETVFSTDSSKPLTQYKKLKSNLTDDTELLKKHMSDKKSRELDHLDSAFESVLHQMKKDHRNGNLIGVNMSIAEEEYVKILKMRQNFNNLSYIYIFKEKRDIYEKLSEESKRLNDTGNYNASQYFHQLAMIADLPALVIETFLIADNSKREKIEKLVEENSKFIEQLKNFEKSVNTELMSDLEELVGHVLGTKDSVVDRYKIDFDLLRSHVRNTLSDTKNLLNKYVVNTFETKKIVLINLETLESLIPFLIKKNSEVRDIRDREEFADLMLNINSVHQSIHEEYKNFSQVLEAKLYSNLLMRRYQISYRTLEQLIFPFGSFHLKNTLPPRKFKLENDVKKYLSNMIFQLKEIIQDLRDSEIKLKITNFYGDNDIRRPFFTWKNEEYHESIKKLLSGEEIILNSDLKHRGHHFQCDAVKYDTISLYLKAKNSTIQKELDEMVIPILMDATHLGNSYYTLKNETYLMMYNRLRFLKSLLNLEPGVKIREGLEGGGGWQSSSSSMLRDHYLLSPYATWKIQLTTASMYPVNFTDFKKYENEIDLELGGRGMDIYDAQVETNFHYESLQVCEN